MNRDSNPIIIVLVLVWIAFFAIAFLYPRDANPGNITVPSPSSDYLTSLEPPDHSIFSKPPQTLLKAANTLLKQQSFGVVAYGVEDRIQVVKQGEKTSRAIKTWGAKIKVGVGKKTILYLFKSRPGYNWTNIFTGYSCLTQPGTITVFAPPKQGENMMVQILIGHLDKKKAGYSGTWIDPQGKKHELNDLWFLKPKKTVET